MINKIRTSLKQRKKYNIKCSYNCKRKKSQQLKREMENTRLPGLDTTLEVLENAGKLAHQASAGET